MGSKHFETGQKNRPGGYFIGTNGKPHDAHGRPIEEEAAEPEKEKPKK